MPRPGPRTTNKYSDRFKATAVRLSELPGVVTVPPFSSQRRCGRTNISRDTGGKHGGRFSAEGSMRSDVVVVRSPALDA